jgi:Sec-independent protein secretion pathway component TatC
MLAVPLCVLFEVGVLVAGMIKKKEAQVAEASLDSDEIAPHND